jgi:hypothetical protein
MVHWYFLTVAFHSLLGDVKSGDIGRSFQLMGLGMLGIFLVMLLIYVVVVLLNRLTGKKKKSK